MEKGTDKSNGMTRREFMTLGAAASAALALGVGSIASAKSKKSKRKKKGSTDKRWEGEYCVQSNIDMSKMKSGIIRARIEGEWTDCQIRELPRDFAVWNFDQRAEDLKMMFDTFKAGGMPNFRSLMLGPHSPAIASYGGEKRDSQFSINNAIKGMGWVPKAEHLKETIEAFQKAGKEIRGTDKLAFLRKYYTKHRNIYDLTKQISLELYSTPKFETHTFLNVMENPCVSLVYLDNPSYEARAIAQFIHPNDPNLSPEDRMMMEYINMMHKFFHERFKRTVNACVYHIIETFDNSPGKPEAMGRRMVPAPK